MTELFNGGEMDAFLPSESAVREDVGSRFNSSFARCAIKVGTVGSGTTAYAETVHWSAQTAAYFHCDFHYDGGVSTGYPIRLLDGSDTEVIRVGLSSGLTLTVQYLDALSAWQTAGAVEISADVTHTLDLYWDFSASGSIDLYVSGTRRVEGSADLSHLSGVEYARLYESYNPTYFSQVMADTEPTIGHRLYTVPPTGAGANTDWTGTYTEVDEIAYSDADFINSGTANEVETFATSATIPNGYVVQSVTVSARSKTDGSGPSNLQLALRSSGTDYFSSSKAQDIGYEPYQNIWETNPATAAAWVNTAISSLQPGVKSIT